VSAFSTPDRQLLYSLLCRQLLDDGLSDLAHSLSAATGAAIVHSFPSRQLSSLVALALQQLQQQEFSTRQQMRLGRPEDDSKAEAEQKADMDEQDGEVEPAGSEKANAAVTSASDSRQVSSSPFAYLGAMPSLLDLTSRAASASASSVPFPPYACRYSSALGDACTAATFSSDGSLVAAAARDGSIQLLDVARMKLDTSTRGGAADRINPAFLPSGRHHRSGDRHHYNAAGSVLSPQLHRWLDFDAACSDLAFHPFEPFLLAASRDASLKFFSVDRVTQTLEQQGGVPSESRDPAARKAHKLLAVENAPVCALSFHPSGDWVAVASESNFARLYDVRSFASFCSPDFAAFHRGALTDVRYHPQSGSSYATASVDGSIRVWDGVGGRCVRVMEAAHGGAPVMPVRVEMQRWPVGE